MKMQVQVFDQPAQDVLRVKLVPNDNRGDVKGGVTVVAVDADGTEILAGKIVTINENGVYIWPYLAKSVDLPRDDNKQAVKLIRTANY
jgi:hypothetical protein